jgi:hypothetical protein
MFRTLPPLLILAIALSVPVHAQEDERDTASQRQDAGDRVREVERDGGRVLQAEPMQRSGREVYRLKVITPEGRVRVLDDSRRRDARPAPMPRESEMRREPSSERMDGAGPEPGPAGDGRS